jgi:hypothetical protein
MAIQELDLKIEYRPGKTNGRADALSRCPVPAQSDGTMETIPVVVSSIQAETGTEVQSGELSA